MSDSEEVKQAVKEALSDKRIEDLGSQLNALSTQMSVGFAGVHEKQDQTNGKVQLHTAEIERMKAKDGYNRFIWYMFTVSLVIIGSMITYILTNIKK